MWKGRREAWARWGGRVEGMGFPRRLLARLHRCGGRRPVDAANAEAGWPCWLHCCMSAAPGNGDRHKRNRLAILDGRIGGSRCGPSGAFPARGGPCGRPHPSERESVGAMPSSMDCQVTILCDVFLSQSGPFAKGRIVTSVCSQTDRQTVNV